MKRFLCILLLALAGFQALAAGYRVRGRVTDAQGEPLPGAVVANLVKWGFPAINGMVVAAIIWGLGQLIQKKK